MKKKRMKVDPSYREGCKKMFFWTTQLFALLLVFNFNLSARAYSQHHRLSVELKNATLEEFIAAVKQKCDVGFIYDYNRVKDVKGINVSAREETLETVLQRALKGTGLQAEVENNTIILSKFTAPQTNTEVKVIHGKVRSKSGELLPGVTVMIKGTTLGTVTNDQGVFQLSIPEPVGKVLVFSFIGMATQEVKIKNTEPLNVTLEETVSEMEEAVVTGIYTRKKESFTGSATTYTADDLKTIGNFNILQSLKTLDPSFAIIENNQFGSDPNRMPEININGKSSIAGLNSEYENDPNAPLFILDGFETTLEAINDLSMDRIESITILKDATSTAIYGSKAANGVLVVETKKPEAGKLRVNYAGNFTFSWADLTDYNLMDSEEKLEFEKLSGYYGSYNEDGEFLSDVNGKNYYNRLAEVRRGVNTWWINEPLRVAFTHGHNLFIEGGDNSMRYSVGLSYRNQQGVMEGSDRDAMNGNVRLIYRYKNISFTNYTNIDLGNAISENAAFSDFSRANPYYRKRNEYGEVIKVLEAIQTNTNTYTYVYNPLYNMEQNSLNRTKTYNLTNNFEIEWRVLPALRVRGRFNVLKGTTKNLVFVSPNHTSFVNAELTDRGKYSETNGENVKYNGDFTVTFGKVFREKHQVNAVGGMDFQNKTSQKSGYSVKGFMTDRFDNPAFSDGYVDGGRPVYSETESRSASYFLNAGYSYDNRYLVDGNFRMDGSSVFGVNNLFTKTWSAGVGWNLHNESFLRQSDWLTFLKLRFSVGNPGNQNIEAKMANNQYSYVTSFPNPFGLAAAVSKWGNKDLDWQKTLNYNYGLDIEVFKRRLRFTFDYYLKKSDPQIISVSLPSSAGASSVPMNLGGLKSYGYTLSATVNLIKKQHFFWTVNGNLRHSVSEYYNIGDLLQSLNSENISRNLVRYYDGGSTSSLWAVRSMGIDPATGREVFMKKDGTQTYNHDYDDEVNIGDSTPKVEGIVGTSFYYKGFSVNVNFRYRAGGQIFMQTLYDKVENISREGLRNNQDKRALYDRWQKPGDRAKFKAISLTDTTPISSRFIEDENTFSCESCTVGYETTANWLNKIGAASFNVRASMSDIFRISTVKNERGLDYPFQRSVNFSLGVRF